MKILVTGARGQLGHDVVRELTERGHEAVGVDIEEMDITDPVRVKQVILNTGCEAVIHCAAYTAVDAAEDHADVCRRINVDGTENIACVCKAADIPMMYFSTDYVFAGDGVKPWQPNDPKAPLNVYGQSKYDGELAVQGHLDQYFIIRISWVFGLNGKNFVKTMLNLGKTRDSVTVVDDQIGSPTYTRDLAVLVADMIVTDKYGVYHATNEGVCSWYEFACEIFSLAGRAVRVDPVNSAQYPARARRPSNSRLDKHSLVENGFHLLPAWQDALARYLEALRVDSDGTVTNGK